MKKDPIEDWLDGIRAAIIVAECARLDRPEKPRGMLRRRCGDVIRWKANNAAVDQIVSDLKSLSPPKRGKK